MNRKYFSALFVSAFLLLINSGCVVQSLYPFCTPESVCKLPEIEGEWDVTMKFGEEPDAENPTPWSFSGRKITTYDEDSSSRLKVKYFKIGDAFFADLTAGNIQGNPEKVNLYWLAHVVPAHTVCKVELEKDDLRIILLNPEWFEKEFETGKTGLVITEENTGNKLPLILSESKINYEFVKKYANSKEAFDPEFSLVFKRHRKEDTPEVF